MEVRPGRVRSTDAMSSTVNAGGNELFAVVRNDDQDRLLTIDINPSDLDNDLVLDQLVSTRQGEVMVQGADARVSAMDFNLLGSLIAVDESLVDALGGDNRRLLLIDLDDPQAGTRAVTDPIDITLPALTQKYDLSLAGLASDPIGRFDSICAGDAAGRGAEAYEQPPKQRRKRSCREIREGDGPARRNCS